MDFFDYLESLRYRASRCHLSQKELAKQTGIALSTLNTHLNRPGSLRLWELQKIKDIIEAEEKKSGMIWIQEGTGGRYETTV